MDLVLLTRHTDLDGLALLLAQGTAHIVRVVPPPAAGELVGFDVAYDKPDAARSALNAYGRGEQLVNLRDFVVQRRRLSRLARDARLGVGGK
jgi:hypothetical protein